MALEVVVRRWGNSFGVVFPKDYVEEKNIRVNEKVMVEVVREADFKGVFGSLKGGKSAQQFKDQVRRGWR